MKAITVLIVGQVRNQHVLLRSVANLVSLQNKGLVLLILTSFLGNLIISFLHNFVPIILVSITDALGGIVVAILAVIWAIFFMIFAIISIVKAIH